MFYLGPKMINYEKYKFLKPKLHKGGSYTVTSPFHIKDMGGWWKEHQMRVGFSGLPS